MKGLIIKDFMNIGNSMKTLIILLFVYAVLFISSFDAITFIIVMAIVFSTTVPVTFSYDNISKWDRFALTLPVSREQIVKSKFITLIIFTTISILITMIVAIAGIIINSSVRGNSISNMPELILQIVLTTLIAIIFAIVLGSTNITLLFKFGVEKARIISISLSFLPAIIILWLNSLNIDFDNVIQNISLAMVFITSTILLVLYCIALYKISIKIYSKKEFA